MYVEPWFMCVNHPSSLILRILFLKLLFFIFYDVHLYDLLDVLDLVDELHLCHPHVVLEPPDHTQQ